MSAQLRSRRVGSFSRKGAKQHGDEVDTRLDREHLARLDRAGGAEEGCSGGGGAGVSGASCRPGHIVHLDAQVVPHSVGEEGPAETLLHGLVGLGLQEAVLLEQAGDLEVARWCRSP